MDNIFLGAKAFDTDLSKWNVSRVTSMMFMFSGAKIFDMDLSKWNVSRVTSMMFMFWRASTFKQSLCGKAWVDSKATKTQMFYGSLGEISTTECGACSVDDILI